MIQPEVIYKNLYMRLAKLNKIRTSILQNGSICLAD